MPVAGILDQDVFLRRTAQAVAGIFSTLLAIVPTLIIAYVGFNVRIPESIESTLDHLFGQALVPQTGLVTTIVGAAPIAVAAICYLPNTAPKRLNRFGKAICILALYGLVAGIVANQLMQNDLAAAIARAGTSAEAAGTLGSREVYDNLSLIVSTCITVYIFYLAYFFGLSS